MRYEMRKSKKIGAIRAKPGVQATQWPELAEEWQTAGREWASWWSSAVTGGSADAARRGSIVDTGLVLPALPAAWIQPEALADITWRYRQRFAPAGFSYCGPARTPAQNAIPTVTNG